VMAPVTVTAVAVATAEKYFSSCCLWINELTSDLCLFDKGAPVLAPLKRLLVPLVPLEDVVVADVSIAVVMNVSVAF